MEHFIESEKMEIISLLKLFQSVSYFFWLIINTARIRLPFSKKKHCLVKILEKESKEIALEVPFGDDVLGGIPVKIFFFHFKVAEKSASIEVDSNIYAKFFEGERLSIKYINGFDRVHAQLVLEGN